ncbi:hypothetical protein FDENT_8473 [Fusarium denticulatum]|uniref:Heterokaryon incompatibility domain-containing protein n=1 Tax=Fusarium denticulatum TaxID=48507 RepID=A0A8H5X2T8_9HYPO|nr:hypothetical protein FDENT_8473 [Fusarium denticulatum]
MDPFSRIPAELRLQIFSCLPSKATISSVIQASPIMLEQYLGYKSTIIRHLLERDFDDQMIQDAMAIIFYPSLRKARKSKLCFDAHLLHWDCHKLPNPLMTHDTLLLDQLDKLHSLLMVFVEVYITKATADFQPREYICLPQPTYSQSHLVFKGQKVARRFDSCNLSECERRRLLRAFLRVELGSLVQRTASFESDSFTKRRLMSYVGFRVSRRDEEAIRCVWVYTSSLYGAVFAQCADAWLPIADTPSETGLLFPDNVLVDPFEYGKDVGIEGEERRSAIESMAQYGFSLIFTMIRFAIAKPQYTPTLKSFVEKLCSFRMDITSEDLFGRGMPWGGFRGLSHHTDHRYSGTSPHDIPIVMDHGIVRVVKGGWLDELTRDAVTRPDTSTILWETLHEPWDLFTRLDKGVDVAAVEPVTLVRDVCSGHDSSEKNCSVVCTSSDDLFASWKTLWQCLSLTSLTLANSTFSTLDEGRGGNGTSREQISSALMSFGIANATDFDGKAVLNLTYECAAASCRDTSMGECSIGQLSTGYFQSETIQWIKVYEALAPLCDGLESDINIDIAGPGVLITYITQTAMVVFAWLFFLLLKVNKFINTATSIFTHLFRKGTPGRNLLTHRISGLERLERTNLAHATSTFLAELHEAQCFFVVAIEIALINASSRSAIFTGAENWQSLLWNRDSVQFLAGMGAWPIILGQISLRRAELDSMYYLLLSTLALVLAGVAADTASNPDPDRIYKMFQGQNTLQECGGHPSLRTFCVEEREGLYCDSGTVAELIAERGDRDLECWTVGGCTDLGAGNIQICPFGNSTDLSAVYSDKITLKGNAQIHFYLPLEELDITMASNNHNPLDLLKVFAVGLVWTPSVYFLNLWVNSQPPIAFVTIALSRASPGESTAQEQDVTTPLLPAVPRSFSSGDCERGVKARNLSVQVSATRDFGRWQSLRIRLYEKRSSLFPWLKIQDASYAPFKHNCWQSNTTGAEASFLWAREIVDKCEREHHNCRNHFIRSTSQRYFPKRLIDVQARGQGVIQLVLSETLKSERAVEYAAFSHCWGTTVKSELRKENEETMKTIRIETLDPSFRDAVDITYRMGIKYLWIDSLCIMQRTEEWEEESGDMGLVYARAKVVISATASKNSDGGYYRPKDLFPYDCVLCSNTTSALVVRSPIKYPDLVQHFGEKVDRSFLATRGWTFQERFLASRILHFCSGLLMFECNTLTTSECHREEEYPLITHFTQDGTLNVPKVPHPGREPPKQLCSSTTVQYTGSSTRLSTRPSDNTVGESWHANPKYELWAEWKQLYDVQMSSMRTNAARLSTRGAFSFLWSFRGQDMKEKAGFHLSDKMMAIAGVAYFIQQSTGFKYASGLWEETYLSISYGWWNLESKGDRLAGLFPHAFLSGSRISFTVDGSSGSDSWDYIKSLISDLEVQATHMVNGMAHNATLRLSCQLQAFSPSPLGCVYDTLEYHEQREIRCLPVLEFAVSSTSSQAEGTRARYMRVGYFCTEKTNINFQDMGREGLLFIELI